MFYVVMRVPIFLFLFVVTATYLLAHNSSTLPAAKVLLAMMSVLKTRQDLLHHCGNRGRFQLSISIGYYQEKGDPKAPSHASERLLLCFL